MNKSPCGNAAPQPTQCDAVATPHTDLKTALPTVGIATKAKVVHQTTCHALT